MHTTRSSTPVNSPNRAWRLLGALACVAALAACSSGSSGSEGADGSASLQDLIDDAKSNEGGGDGEELAPVCELIEPVVQDLIAAFDVGIPATEEGLYERGKSECFLDFSDESVAAGELYEAHIWVKRAPAIFSTTDEAAHTVGVSEPSPAPSIAEDALVYSNESMAVVLVAVDERVYEISTSYPFDDTAASATPIEEAVLAVAPVAYAALGG